VCAPRAYLVLLTRSRKFWAPGAGGLGSRVTIRARYVTYLRPPSFRYGIVADAPLPPKDR
jgi:hypothetical protein